MPRMQSQMKLREMRLRNYLQHKEKRNQVRHLWRLRGQQGSALFPILSALYIVPLLYLFEHRAQALNLDTSTLSYVDDGLLVSQGRVYNKTLPELTSSYSIVSDLMASFGLVMEHDKSEIFLRLGEQVSSSKAPAGWATALDTELFAIRLGVVKATSFDVKCIIIITNSLTAARRAVDASVHSSQAHSLAII